MAEIEDDAQAVAEALSEALDEGGYGYWINTTPDPNLAYAAIEALAKRGRLLPSGGEVEWAVRRDHEGNGTHWVSEPFYRREHAEALLASMSGGGDPMYVVSRRIQAGPWQSTVLSDNSSEVPDGD